MILELRGVCFFREHAGAFLDLKEKKKKKTLPMSVTENGPLGRESRFNMPHMSQNTQSVERSQGSVEVG